MDFSIFTDNFPAYLSGFWTTLILVFSSLLFALALSVPLALVRVSNYKTGAALVWLFCYCFRGTPLLVQLFIIYYGSSQLSFIRDSGLLWPLFSSATFCCLLAFTLNSTAYTTELIRGAIKNTPNGEIEAAVAYGMNYWTRQRRIVLPNAFRRGLAAYSNEVIFMLHGSAIASVITIMDLTGVARQVYAEYYSPYEAFISAAIFYMLITFVIVFIFRKLERRYAIK